MQNNFKIEVDDKNLKKLKNNFNKLDYVVKVGILGGKYDDVEGGTFPPTIATVGLIQEFGSVKKNIPERSFIRKPLQNHLKEELAQSKTLKKVIYSENASPIDKYNILGAIAQNIITGSFENLGDGTWQPNAPATIKQKGSSQPLIDTGRLRKSITFEVVKQ